MDERLHKLIVYLLEHVGWGSGGEKKLLNYKPCAQTERECVVVSAVMSKPRGWKRHKEGKEVKGRKIQIYSLTALCRSLPALCSKVCES